MLEIKNLTKVYDESTIFKNLNFTINDGEVLTIVGPSGSGKTTLLKIVAGLLPADQGTLTLDGTELDITGNRIGAAGAKVGVIFQDFNLFPNYTVKENIMLAPLNVAKIDKQTADQEAEELIAELGLTEQANSYPYQISGGQKQRAAIARALAMKPAILAYDEPTSGLDEESTQRVIEVIHQLKQKGVTQIVVTHDLPFEEAISDKSLDFATDIEV
ncbi:MAG: ATP-binding cassette domain-containing protein [Lactobacillaceae bacterium]|jgi:polar amino acid transport system ATP-binding protein|nr:ATP-binding cassette domain-containing protein [Lactobacillaceae bacterium]